VHERTGRFAIRSRCLRRSRMAKTMLTRMASTPIAEKLRSLDSYRMTPTMIVSSERIVCPEITNGMRNMLSTSMVGIGAMLRHTTIVPSVEYCMATIDVASMPTKSGGTVVAQRIMSSRPPYDSCDGCMRTKTTVKSIWMATRVKGTGKWLTASLLKMDMPAEAHM